MLYVQEVLTQGEKIVYGARYHWWFLARGFIWLAIYWFLAFFVTWAGVAFESYNIPIYMLHQAVLDLSFEHYIYGFWSLSLLWRLGAFALILLGLFHLGMVFLIKATTEMAVTTRRLIFKRGWIARNVEEMAIENIESVQVKQTILGRLLGYGDVDSYGTGEGDINLPSLIDDPIVLRRMIQKVQTELRERHY